MKLTSKKLKLGLLLLFLGLAYLGGLPVWADEGESLFIEELHLSIWPEYYTPDVVVTQSGLFVNVTEEPFQGDIWFQLPKAVEPIMVAEFKDGIHRHYYEVIDKGDHQLVRYELVTPLEPGEKLPLMLEYRYPRFQKGGNRNISIELISKYHIGWVDVEIKQPLRSTEFTLDPIPESRSMDVEGFDVYRFPYGKVEANQLVEFRMSYNKEDNLPSVDPTPAEAETIQTEQQAIDSTSVIFLVLIILVVLGLTLFLALRTSHVSRPDAVKSKGPGGRKQGVAGIGAKKGTVGKDKFLKTKEPLEQKKKLRKMLVEGKITEQTYEKLLAELDKK